VAGVIFALFVVPLVEPHQSLLNSDWPALATGGALAVSDPAHLYDIRVQDAQQRRITGGEVLVARDEEGLLPFDMPPWVALLNAPFAALGTDLGGRLWILAGLVALAAGFFLLATPGRRIDSLPALAAVPTALAVVNAQTDGLVVLGIGAAWAMWNRDQPLAAGAALGLCLVKPQLVLPLGTALLVTRSWRVLAGWAGAGAALAALSALREPRWLLDWPRFLAAHAGRVGTELGPIQFVWSSGQPRSAQLAAAALVVLLAIAGVLLLAWRRPPNLAAGILVAGGLLAAPHALGSDLVLVPAALLVGQRGTWLAWILVSVLALVAALSKGTLVSTMAGTALVGMVLLQLRVTPAVSPAGL